MPVVRWLCHSLLLLHTIAPSAIYSFLDLLISLLLNLSRMAHIIGATIGSLFFNMATMPLLFTMEPLLLRPLTWFFAVSLVKSVDVAASAKFSTYITLIRAACYKSESICSVLMTARQRLACQWSFILSPCDTRKSIFYCCSLSVSIRFV